MKDYQAIELPNINDATIARTMVAVQKLVSVMHEFYIYVGPQHARIPFTTNTIVVFIIIPRILEGARSTLLLCQKNFARDAGILLTNICELRLDLEYIGISRDRAKIWLSDTKENKKPWKVADQIKELSGDKKEEDAEFSVYRNLSMAKHGNLSGKNISFPISRVDKDVYQLNWNQKNDPLIHCHMFILGTYIKRAGMAAIQSYDDAGFEVAGFADKFDELWNTLSKYNTEHITSVLKEWVAGE